MQQLSSSQHLCVLHVATAGLQGPALGSDEEEIILLIYVVIDINHNKVMGAQQYLVRPTVADVNENVLSEQITSETPLTEELVKSAGQPLEAALRQFDRYARATLHATELGTAQFRLVTDGQLALRQCLHPETCNKEITLPNYYNSFYDLRKEVVRHTRLSAEQQPQSVREMLTCLNLSPEIENEFYIKEVKDIVNILQRLISEGHRFEVPETINLVLEPGICSKDDEIDSNCVVRARGLPWQSSDQDIAKFFRGLNVSKGGVALCLSPQGRRNGEALVRFECQEHRDMALKRHKHHIGARYIEVYRASGEDFLSVAGGASNEAQAFLSKGAQVIIRMRGLPYDCTAKQVLDFFASGEKPCTVLDGEDGVLFVKKLDGRATGDAFVLFAEESEAPKALAKHRELIGSRYIELFRSTTAEVQQVLNRSLDPKTYEQNPQQQPLIAQLPQVPLLPQHIITSGTRKDCIRLRGLPYEAQVEHILDFLGDHAKSIVFQGVHMVYNAQGQPSGEAFIQMDSEQSAFMAAQQKHHRYMVFGKKQRYIEVFQCSGEDMNLVLTGGIPAPVSPAKAATAALLSPGMLHNLTAVPQTPNLAQPPPGPPPGPPQPQLQISPVQAQWDLYAQQQAQAHLIAQQTLLARQADQQALFMLAAANQAPAQNPHLAATQGLQQPLLIVPQRLPIGMHPQRQVLQHHQFIPTAAQGLIPMVPHVAAVKRTYGDAFHDQTVPAKRVFQTQPPPPPHSAAIPFPTYYSNI